MVKFLSPDEARELLEDELAKGKYQDIKPWTQIVMEWLQELIERIFGLESNLQANWAWIIIAIIAVILVVVSWRLLVIRQRRQTQAQAVVFVDEPLRDYSYWLQESNTALEDGDLSQAVIYGFRSILLAANQSAHIDLRGKTASEACALFTRTLPEDLVREIRRAATTFETTVYGTGSPTPEQVDTLHDLATKVVRQNDALTL